MYSVHVGLSQLHDVEGIKLDITILEYKIESIISTKSEASRNMDKVDIEQQLREVNETCETLKNELILVEKEEAIVKEKDVMIRSLESKLTKEKLENLSIG